MKKALDVSLFLHLLVDYDKPSLIEKKKFIWHALIRQAEEVERSLKGHKSFLLTPSVLQFLSKGRRTKKADRNSRADFSILSFLLPFFYSFQSAFGF
jgi:hypothetical protein